jgi:hypothetical protein
VIQFTDEQMRKLIKEEAEKFLNSPYDASFDLVLEEISPGFDPSKYTNPMAQAAKKARTAAQAKAAQAAAGGGGGTGGASGAKSASAPDDEPLPNVLPTWRQKLDKATAATKKGLGKAAAATKTGLDKFRASDINQKGGEAILDLGKRTAAGLGKAGIGTAGAIGKGVGAAAGGALGGAVTGLAKGVKGAMDMFRGNPVQRMAKKAKKAGLGAAEVAKLHQAYQSGALSEKQIATLKLMERCLKSGKVRIIKENKKPIIIDV